MKNRLYTYLTGWIFLWLPALLLAQAIDGPTALFLMHSSGNHVAKDAQGGAVLEAADAPSPQKLTFILTVTDIMPCNRPTGKVICH